MKMYSVTSDVLKFNKKDRKVSICTFWSNSAGSRRVKGGVTFRVKCEASLSPASRTAYT